MFGNSWRAGRIAGIEIRIDVSWVVIALLVFYSLYFRFDITYPRLGAPQAVLLGAGAAALFFASVLIHELAHAVLARRRGIQVRSITLFLFGGATHAKVEARGPGAEFVVAAVGPLTSLVLAGVFSGIGFLGRDVMPEPIVGGLIWLGFINGVLAAFNLVPGFPLDGGRLLRAAVWRATGSLVRATKVASIAGQAVGYLLVGGGLFLVFREALGAGIWFAAIGWFLAQAARTSSEQMQVRGLLAEAEAEDVMVRDLVPIPPDLTLREAVDRYFLRHDHGAFPVEEDGRTLGLLTLRRVKQVSRERWESTSVRETMGKLDEQITVGPHARMDGVLEKLEGGEAHRVLVVEEGDLLGIITRSDVARWLQRRQAIGA